mgnify:CR=1 FL=1
MKKYLCEACGYIYDPEVGDPDNGVEAGTAFEDQPHLLSGDRVQRQYADGRFLLGAPHALAVFLGGDHYTLFGRTEGVQASAPASFRCAVRRMS